MASASLSCFRARRHLLRRPMNEPDILYATFRSIGPRRMKRPDHGSDVPILENWTFRSSEYDDIHHNPRQVVCTNHLVGKQRPKQGVNPAQHTVADIRFLARLHWVDVGGPEDVNVREPRRKGCLLSLSLVTSESHSALSRWVRATPAQKRECRVGAG